ncbi:sigma-54-dependent Fis family transcriptional regulator [Candidatus Saganbacteria bacterium]|nr:sigma-54-dependent Fis family transcriptional regulator [Candidatus Saganbacteria bacterium]
MILLLEDDLKTAAQIKEALGEELVVCDKVQDFLHRINEKPQLAIIDFDLRETDGLMVYRKLREQAPYLKTIMLSGSNNIPLAVSATRMGVADFLRKPLELAAFKAAVQTQLKAIVAPGPTLSAEVGGEWLNGTSEKLQHFLADFQSALTSNQDLGLAAERGINLGLLARTLHKHGPSGKRKFVEFNLAAFSRDTLESHFWATLQELLLSREEASLPEQQELAGTLYFEGWEAIPDHFKNSLLEFLKKRPAMAGLMKDVRVIVAAGQEIAGFGRLVVPPLRERKEDLPLIVAAEVRRLARDPVYLSPRVMEFFAYYDFPGNYEELRVILECALRNHPRDLKLSSFLLNAGQLVQAQFKQAMAGQSYELKSVRERFESELLTYVVQSAGGDTSQAARFLDLPRTALLERLKTLGIKTED